MSFIKNYPLACNRERLKEELVAIGAIEFVFRDDHFEVISAVAQSAVDTVIASHDDTVLTNEQQQEAVKNGAKSQVSAIPNWATWTEQQALDWLTNNIEGTVPAPVYAWMQAITRMNIALRNETFPDLQGS